MSTPEALRLAGVLERMPLGEVDQMAADMLRAQSAEIERLTAALDEARAERSVAYLAFERVSAERDALRAALKDVGLFLHHCWCDVQMNDHSFERLNAAMEAVDQARKPARAQAQKGGV